MSVEVVDSNCEGEPDHGLALQRGYMCSPNDWYNVEFTGYVKLDTPASDSIKLPHRRSPKVTDGRRA